MIEITITAGGASSLILQFIKWIWRKYVAKDPSYDFPTGFYVLSLPVLNILIIPLLALLGFSGFTMPTDWLMWGKTILQVLVATAISFFTYNEAIKPLASYRNMLLREKALYGIK